MVMGVLEPVDTAPPAENWRQEMAASFHQVVVDEGHLVFAHQPLSHLDGQHLLRNCDDVRRVVEAVAVPGCRMTIFHDEDYQGVGVPVSYPSGCERVTAGLAMVRCPGSVRDQSVMYAQSLCDEEGGLSEGNFVPLVDERNKGPDVVLVDVEKPLEWKRQMDSSGSGVLAFASELTNVMCLDMLASEVTDKYAEQICKTLVEVSRDYVNAEGSTISWGDVAVVTPGDPHDLFTDIVIQIKSTVVKTEWPGRSASEIADVITLATTNAADCEHLYFGPVQNMAGLERAIVVVTGFWHPLSLLAKPPTAVASRGGAARQWLKRVDYRVYLGVTRCTHQLYVVEPDVKRFASHFRIRDVVATGGEAALVGLPVGGGAKTIEVEAGRPCERGLRRLTDFTFSDLTELTETLLAYVACDSAALAEASTDLKNDRDLVLAVVQENGEALQHASDELKSDRDIAFEAVQQNGEALQHASDELKSNHDVVLAAVQQNGEALQHASGELKSDRDIVLAAVQQNGEALQHASDELKGDPDIVLAAVQQNGEALQHSSGELKSDRDVMLAAVEHNGLDLHDASDELKNERDIVFAAVQQNGMALLYASSELKRDCDIALAAVQQDGNALNYAPDELKNNRDVVLAAVKQNGMALWHASDELKSDRDVVLAAVQQNWRVFACASGELKNDRDFVLQLNACAFDWDELEVRVHNSVPYTFVNPLYLGASGDGYFDVQCSSRAQSSSQSSLYDFVPLQGSYDFVPLQGVDLDSDNLFGDRDFEI